MQVGASQNQRVKTAYSWARVLITGAVFGVKTRPIVAISAAVGWRSFSQMKLP